LVEIISERGISIAHIDFGFKSFETAMKTIEGIETMHMIKKEQVKFFFVLQVISSVKVGALLAPLCAVEVSDSANPRCATARNR
jgi:hypothetical protein